MSSVKQDVLQQQEESAQSAKDPTVPRKNKNITSLLAQLPTSPRVSQNLRDEIQTSDKQLLLFSHEETFQLHKEVIIRLNKIFTQHKLELVPGDFLKKYHSEMFDLKHSWLPWKKAVVAAKQSEPPSFIFKAPLMTAIQHAFVEYNLDDPPTLRRCIPVVLFECANFVRQNIESVGVFRVSGSDKRINSLISKFDAGPEYGKSISFEGYNVFDVADCLKKYFRTLPEPLLTTHLYPFWLRVLDIPDEAQKAKSLQLLCFLLPKAHLISFEYLISLLKFTSTFEKNQMDMSNLSKIFAPSIMWPKAPQVQSKQDYEQSALLIELFAKHSQKLEMTAPSVVPYQVLDLPI